MTVRLRDRLDIVCSSALRTFISKGSCQEGKSHEIPRVPGPCSFHQIPQLLAACDSLRSGVVQEILDRELLRHDGARAARSRRGGHVGEHQCHRGRRYASLPIVLDLSYQRRTKRTESGSGRGMGGWFPGQVDVICARRGALSEL